MKKLKIKSEKFIANYDLNPEYNYSDFWLKRDYEHASEVILLEKVFNKLFDDKNNNSILDLGGGHARLASIYKDKFKQCVIGDYSLNELQEGKKNLIKMNALNFQLIAMNAYKIPFVENSFDSVVSVRLMHHIKDAELFFSEIYRILKPEGYFILEVANKHHIKNILKNLVKMNLKALNDHSPLKVKHNRDSSQGISLNQIPIMYNYSKKYIIEKAIFQKFQVISTLPCSFFRSNFIKQKISTHILISLEKFMQRLEFLTLTPSIFYIFKKPNLEDNKSENLAKMNILSRLCSPIGYSPVEININENIIKSNIRRYKIINGIYDLREPRPEEVNF